MINDDKTEMKKASENMYIKDIGLNENEKVLPICFAISELIKRDIMNNSTADSTNEMKHITTLCAEDEHQEVPLQLTGTGIKKRGSSGLFFLFQK